MPCVSSMNAALERAGLLGQRSRRAVEAYLRTCPRTQKRATARASASRLMRHPHVRAAMQWFYARLSREIPREEPMPNTASGIWVRLAELGCWRAKHVGDEKSLSLLLTISDKDNFSTRSPSPMNDARCCEVMPCENSRPAKSIRFSRIDRDALACGQTSPGAGEAPLRLSQGRLKSPPCDLLLAGLAVGRALRLTFLQASQASCPDRELHEG